MFFNDHGLARRLEALDSANNLAYARTKANLRPESKGRVLAIADGWAIFTGQHSPINRLFGLGMTTGVADTELATAERFFQDCGVATQVDLCPLAHPALPQLLRRRGYRLLSFKHTWYRPVEADTRLPDPPAYIRIEVIGQDADDGKRLLWAQVVSANGAIAPEQVTDTEIALPVAYKPDAVRFLAWIGAEAAGGGALASHDGAAVCFSTFVRPSLRRRGVQQALLRARIDYGRAIGCDLVMLQTAPDSGSLHNVQRFGFQIAYTKAMMGRPSTNEQ